MDCRVSACKCRFYHHTVWDMCRGVSISSSVASLRLAPLRLASWRSLPDRLQCSRSAPARQDIRRSQFCMFTFFSVATRRLMPAIMLPSRLAPFKLTPSRFALLPAGSSKLDPLRLAASRLAQFILPPSSCAPSSRQCERSARSSRLQDRFAPERSAARRLAYLKLTCLRSGRRRSAPSRLTPWNLSSWSPLSLLPLLVAVPSNTSTTSRRVSGRSSLGRILDLAMVSSLGMMDSIPYYLASSSTPSGLRL